MILLVYTNNWISTCQLFCGIIRLPGFAATPLLYTTQVFCDAVNTVLFLLFKVARLHSKHCQITACGCVAIHTMVWELGTHTQFRIKQVELPRSWQDAVAETFWTVIVFMCSCRKGKRLGLCSPCCMVVCLCLPNLFSTLPNYYSPNPLTTPNFWKLYRLSTKVMFMINAREIDSNKCSGFQTVSSDSTLKKRVKTCIETGCHAKPGLTNLIWQDTNSQLSISLWKAS